MSFNQNPNLNSRMNANHFNINSNNFEQFLNGYEGNNEQIRPEPVEENEPEELQTEVKAGNDCIRIPNQLRDDFDEIVVQLLSMGCESTGKVVDYLARFKSIHFGQPDEVSFMELALLIGGKIKQVKIEDLNKFKCPKVTGQTEKPQQRQFCIQSDIIRPYLPFNFVLKKDINRRVKTQVYWKLPFFTGLIYALERESWERRLAEANSLSAYNLVHKTNRKVQSWQTKKETLHKPIYSAKSSKTARTLSTKLDMVDLQENDPVFARMHRNNLISGVEEYKRYLTDKMSKNINNQVVFDGEQYGQINKDIINEVNTKEQEKLRTKQKILSQIQNEQDDSKWKFIELIVNLGIKDVAGQNFEGLNKQMYEKISKGIMDSLKMINTSSNIEREKFILKGLLIIWIENFFKYR